jgi:diguanylate cyclase
MAAHSRAVGQRLGQSRRTVETLRSSLTEMRHAAETDALTGLPNRRVLEQALTDGAAQAMETGGTLCFALLDIDHFKAFNDTHGHLVGDQVLKLVAKVLGEETRDSDVVARWGGEEFAILMPDTELTGGRELAERIRERVAARRLTKRKTGEVIGQITLSLGLAAYDFGEPLERLTKRADQCLYAAKTAGRNRVLTEAETAEGLVEA